MCVGAASFPLRGPLAPIRNQPRHSTILPRPVCLFVCVGAASIPCARPLLPSSDRSAGPRNQPSQRTVLAPCVPVCVCWRCLLPLQVFGFGFHLPPRLRILHTRTAIFSRCICRPPTHTPPPHTGFPMSAHLSRLRLFQRQLRSLGWVWVWVWYWVHTPPHTLLHTLLSFSPPSFHTISLSLAFTSA